jgi:hypothetical protein
LVNAFDAYREYAVKHADFTISHLSNGAYFLDTRNDIRIYSLSALLRVELLSKEEVMTTLEIFPSEFFGYDPDLAPKLVKSDVFRVGQLATLTISDPYVES